MRQAFLLIRSRCDGHLTLEESVPELPCEEVISFGCVSVCVM